MSSTPTLKPVDMRALRSPSDILSPNEELEPVWDAVRQLKVKALAAMPSKVKSLEGMDQLESHKIIHEPLPDENKKVKRKARCVVNVRGQDRCVAKSGLLAQYYGRVQTAEW